MLHRMAARNRPSSLPVQDVVVELMELNRQHKDLMCQVANLLKAKKFDEAAETMERTELVFAKIEEIQARMKPQRPAGKKKDRDD